MGVLSLAALKLYGSFLIAYCRRTFDKRTIAFFPRLLRNVYARICHCEGLSLRCKRASWWKLDCGLWTGLWTCGRHVQVLGHRGLQLTADPGLEFPGAGGRYLTYIHTGPPRNALLLRSIIFPSIVNSGIPLKNW